MNVTSGAQNWPPKKRPLWRTSGQTQSLTTSSQATRSAALMEASQWLNKWYNRNTHQVNRDRHRVVGDFQLARRPTRRKWLPLHSKITKTNQASRARLCHRGVLDKESPTLFRQGLIKRSFSNPLNRRRELDAHLTQERQLTRGLTSTLITIKINNRQMQAPPDWASEHTWESRWSK